MNDIETMHSIWSDDEVMKYIPVARYRTREDVEKFLPIALSRWEERGFGMFSVINKENDQMIGYSGLQYLEETPEVEIYYGLARDFWKNGYATESARAVLRFGFEHIKLDGISGITHPQNFASQKVLQNIGLQRHSDNRTVYDYECAYFTASRDNYRANGAAYALSFV